MKKLLLILFCLPMIGLGQEWQTSNDAWESVIEELTSISGGENLIPLTSNYIENYPEHSDYLRSETERVQKKEKKFYEGISNFNCINTCDVTWQGNELDGVCYYKHNMEVVNGCIEVKSEVNGANSWDPCKIYIR